MLPSLSEVRSIVKNPKGILKYWRRERNLERFLKTYRSSIEEYLAEANDLTKRMTQQTRNLEATPSTMLTKLKGPIVYVCVRTMTPS